MRSHLVSRTALAVIFGILTASALAQDPNAARHLSATCFTCHGTDGISVGNVPPSLAGQSKDYLQQQLKDFKTGKRPGTVMHQHAKGYTDEQIEQIAAYFSAVKPGVAVPAPRGGN